MDALDGYQRREKNNGIIRRHTRSLSLHTSHKIYSLEGNEVNWSTRATTVLLYYPLRIFGLPNNTGIVLGT